MQLPRGSFRSLERGERLDNLLKKLESDQFSGVCSIVCKGHSIEIVTEKGRILLASCDYLSGEDALAFIGTLLEEPFDASVSDLTPAQVKLALEFNEICIVRHSFARRKESADKKISAPQPRKERIIQPVDRNAPKKQEERVRAIVSPSLPENQKDKGDARDQQEKENPDVLRNSAAKSPETLFEPSCQTDGEAINPPDTAYSLDDMDLKALDSLDLDVMTRKIRDNCKLMVERLHLGYLVIDEDKKESG